MSRKTSSMRAPGWVAELAAQGRTDNEIAQVDPDRAWLAGGIRRERRT